DDFVSWCEDVEKKRQAGQSIALELTEGRALVSAVLDRTEGDDREKLGQVLAAFDRCEEDEGRAEVLLGEAARKLLSRYPDRSHAERFRGGVGVVVRPVKGPYCHRDEIFSSITGHHAGARRLVPGLHRPSARDQGDGFRRALPYAHPPDWPHAPQGPE